MISVIITTHPPLEKHLPRCLASVLWQLEPGDEVLVVAHNWTGDYSTFLSNTNTPAMLVTMQGNLSTARNIGLSKCKPDGWVKFLDVDDLLAPFALNAFRAAHAKGIAPEIAVIGGQMIKVHNGVVRGINDMMPAMAVMHQYNPMVVSSAFVRHSAAIKAMFDERIEFEEDWDFWLRIRRDGHIFASIKVPFCCYCIDDAARAQQSFNHNVEGVDVREYLARKYGITPIR